VTPANFTDWIDLAPQFGMSVIVDDDGRPEFSAVASQRPTINDCPLHLILTIREYYHSGHWINTARDDVEGSNNEILSSPSLQKTGVKRRGRYSDTRFTSKDISLFNFEIL